MPSILKCSVFTDWFNLLRFITGLSACHSSLGSSVLLRLYEMTSRSASGAASVIPPPPPTPATCWGRPDQKHCERPASPGALNFLYVLFGGLLKVLSKQVGSGRGERSGSSTRGLSSSLKWPTIRFLRSAGQRSASSASAGSVKSAASARPTSLNSSSLASHRGGSVGSGSSLVNQTPFPDTRGSIFPRARARQGNRSGSKTRAAP